MRAIGVTPRTASVLGFLAVIAAAGCSATSAAHPVAAVLNQPVTRPAASATATPGATRSPSGAIQNLDVSAAVRSELIAAYAAAQRFPVSYVQGTVSGSVYYAYDPATGTYWARADFAPSATATRDAPADFQDGSSWGYFKRVGTGAWDDGGGGDICDELDFFPLKVLEAWSLPTSPPSGMC